LNLGLSSGETEIVSIDKDISNQKIYIVGTTTATELTASGASKSVFIALVDEVGYVWIKVI